MSNILSKWNFINDCILLMMFYDVFVVYIDTLKFSCPPPPSEPQSLSFDTCWKNTTWHPYDKKNKNILYFKHINFMSWLMPQGTQSFSTPHFQWSTSIQTIINIIGLVIISYSLSPFNSWSLTFYLQKVEYCNFLINYMYEEAHIAYTKIANLEGEFVDLNVLSK